MSKKSFLFEVTKGWTLPNGKRVRKGQRFSGIGTSLDNAAFYLRGYGYTEVMGGRIRVIGTSPFEVTPTSINRAEPTSCALHKSGEVYQAKQNIYSPYSGDLLFKKGEVYRRVVGKEGRVTIATRFGCGVSCYSIDSDTMNMEHLFEKSVEPTRRFLGMLCIADPRPLKRKFTVGKLYTKSNFGFNGEVNPGPGRLSPGCLGLNDDMDRHTHLNNEWREYFTPVYED